MNKTTDTVLYVGFGKESHTPDFSIGMDGYSNPETRRSEGVVDKVYVTCIAMTEGDETILVYTIDTCAVPHSLADEIRQAVTAVTGIPGEKIFCAGTHDHSAPSFYEGDPNVARYRELFFQAVVKAAEEALADRAPATIYSAKPVLKGLNFVRHYKMADGTYAGSNFGSFKTSAAVAHTAESDPQMVLVRFARTGGKRDILLINWQAHADTARKVGFHNISSSFVGPLRDKLEAETGMLAAYITGASGNQNPDSMIESEKHGLSWIEYGEKLANHILAALPEMKRVEGSGIKTTRVIFSGEVNHDWDHLLDAANEVFHLWKTEGKQAGDTLGRTYGFTSSYQARAIRTRAAMGKTVDLEINAFRVGGVGFVTGTYEMFSDAGLYIKANSPFETTFICTGNSSYVPSAGAYEYRCYEADTGFYAKGTAEKLAEEFVRMLEAVQ